MFPLDASSCSETPVLFAKSRKKHPENDGIFTHHFHRAYLLGKEASVCCFLLSFQTKSHGMSAISEGMPDFISCFVRFQSKYKCFPHAPDLLLSFCAGIVRPPGCQIRGFARLRGRRSCCSHATEIQTSPRGSKPFNSGKPDICPLSSFFCRGIACKDFASSSDPRTALDHRGAARCGQPQWLWCISPVSCR